MTDVSFRAQTQLDGWITHLTGEGHALVSRTADAAVLEVPAGRPPNRILHAILTLLTVGLWLAVWLLVELVAVNRRTPVRYTLRVAPDGSVTSTHRRYGPDYDGAGRRWQRGEPRPRWMLVTLAIIAGVLLLAVILG